jgi:hypothetical protein
LFGVTTGGGVTIGGGVGVEDFFEHAKKRIEKINVKSM